MLAKAITGRDGFSLRSAIADLRGVAQLERRSTFIWIYFKKYHFQFFWKKWRTVL